MSYYDRALELKEELTENRRYLHCHAEVGFELPETRAYVTEKLKEYGIEPHPCGEGITALIGKGAEGGEPGKVLLLRADMDALPMGEENDLPFCSRNPGVMHTCGHDVHAANLAGVARIL